MSSDHLVRRVNSGSFPLEMSQMGNGLLRAEKFKILCNRGRTRALSFALAALWEIDPKRLEIGKTTLGKHGARTHIVHYLYATDFESDSREEQRALTTVQRMYRESAAEVSQVFREHFELERDFSVHFEAVKHGLRGDDSVNPNNTAHLMQELSNLVAEDDVLKE